MLPNLSSLSTSTGTHCTDDQTPSPKRVKRDSPAPSRFAHLVGIVNTVPGPDGESISVVRVENGTYAGDWVFLNHQTRNPYRGLGSQYAYGVYVDHDTEKESIVRMLADEDHSAFGIDDEGRDVFEQGELVKFVPLVRERIDKDKHGAVNLVDVYSAWTGGDERRNSTLAIPTDTKGIAVMVAREDERGWD